MDTSINSNDIRTTLLNKLYELNKKLGIEIKLTTKLKNAYSVERQLFGCRGQVGILDKDGKLIKAVYIDTVDNYQNDDLLAWTFRQVENMEDDFGNFGKQYTIEQGRFIEQVFEYLIRELYTE